MLYVVLQNWLKSSLKLPGEPGRWGETRPAYERFPYGEVSTRMGASQNVPVRSGRFARAATVLRFLPAYGHVSTITPQSLHTR